MYIFTLFKLYILTNKIKWIKLSYRLSNTTRKGKKMNKKYAKLKLENQLCFPLYASARNVVGKYSEPLHEIGLTYTQYLVMMVMWEEEQISVKEMGKKLFLDSGTLTPVLKTLEKKGYVSRARSKKDERVLIVTITPEGVALKEDALSVPDEVAKSFTLTEEEAAKLYELLYKLLRK